MTEWGCAFFFVTHCTIVVLVSGFSICFEIASSGPVRMASSSRAPQTEYLLCAVTIRTWGFALASRLHWESMVTRSRSGWGTSSRPVHATHKKFWATYSASHSRAAIDCAVYAGCNATTGMSFSNRFVLPSPLRFRSDGGLYLSRPKFFGFAGKSLILAHSSTNLSFALRFPESQCAG
jgi:hypothetical protein